MAHCRHRGSTASLCLLIDFQIGDLHHERQSGSALRVARCHEPASIVNAVLLRGMTCAPGLPMPRLADDSASCAASVRGIPLYELILSMK